MAYYEDLIVQPNNCLECLLCAEVMENIDRKIESHLYSRKHRECYMRRLMARNSMFIKNTELFCHLCNHNVGISNLTHHVESTHHCKTLDRIKEFIEKDGNFLEISDNDNSINCCICNSLIEFTLESVEGHVTSAKHCRAKVMVLQPLNGIFSVEDHNEYLWCKLCQKFFDNYVELILKHVEESEHAQTMRKLLRLINGQNITIDNFLQCLSQDKAFCKKCEIEVPCNVDNLQRHINGKKHDSKKLTLQ